MLSTPIFHHLVWPDAHREMRDEDERTVSRRLIEARLEQSLKNELHSLEDREVVAADPVVVGEHAGGDEAVSHSERPRADGATPVRGVLGQLEVLGERVRERRLEDIFGDQTQQVAAVGDVVVERFGAVAAGQAILYSAKATAIATAAYRDPFHGVPTEVASCNRRLITASPAQNTSAIAAREYVATS